MSFRQGLRLAYAHVCGLIFAISVAATTVPQSADAQSFPTFCAPVGTLSCGPAVLQPWTYFHLTCNADPIRATEAQAFTDLQADYASACNFTATRQGWLTAPKTSAGCGVQDYLPGYDGGGREIRNGSTYTITYTVCPPNTGPPTTDTEEFVKRKRSSVCPTGWGLDGAICTRQTNRVDPAKMMGMPCPACGNPVSPGLGNKYQEETDYQGSTPFPLVVKRFYNSWFDVGGGFYGTDTYTSVAGADSLSSLSLAENEPRYNRLQMDAIGANWRHYYQRSLDIDTPTGANALPSVTAYRPDGKVLVFVLYNGTWTPDSDITLRLNSLSGGGYQLTTESDDVETYSADGQLLSLANRAGVSHTLAYDSCGRLVSVTHTFGQQLLFGYDVDCSVSGARARITSITLPDSSQITYGYGAAGTLTSVSFPGGTSRSYQYGGASGRLLTGIVDENGTTYASWSYDGAGHAITSQHAGGADSVSLAYNKMCTYCADWEIGRTVVTDAINTQRTYYFTLVKGVARLSQIGAPKAGGPGPVDAFWYYDANGNVSSKKDFRGTMTKYTYDLTRNLETSRTEALNSSGGTTINTRTISTYWHPTYRLPTEIDEPGRSTIMSYDGSGNLLTRTTTDTSVTPHISRTWTYTYDGYGRVLTEDGPRTDVSDLTTRTYYTCATGFECGQLHTVTNAAGQVISYDAYNADGQPLQITDPNGVVTSLTYDARGRLTSTVAAAESTTFDYWPTGLLKKVTLPDASYLQYTYDNAHRLVGVQDTTGSHVSYTLDGLGNRTEEDVYDPSNALARQHFRVFNYLNLLWKDIGSANTAAVTTTYGYDDSGNVISINAPMGRNSSYNFDELNRLWLITPPSGNTIQFGNSSLDQLAWVRDPKNLSTSYTNDAFGGVTHIQSPDTGSTSNVYDSGGNLSTSTDARGAVATYGYDALNRVTSVAYSLGGTTDQTVSFSYDAGTNGKGHLTGASDANHSMSWGYDALGRVTSKSQTVGGVTLPVTYGYTNADLTSLTTPSGQAIVYGYNGNHQATSVTVNGVTVLNSATYEPLGPVNGWTWGNATTALRVYDADGKISQILDSGTKTLSYDNAFRITGISDTSVGASNWTYGYDALDRITSGLSSGGTTRGWTYDANGNRLTETGSAPSTYSVSSTSNQITAITGALARTYGYDAAGNTTSYSTVSATYNDAGRLKTVMQGGVTETLIYNALGQRIQTSGGAAGTVLYAYDEAEHLLGEYDGTGALIEETVWLGGIPVATLRPNGSGSVDVFYVHTDQLNTPRAVTRPVDNMLMWSWYSDPFGTDAANENPSGAGTFKYNLRFAGQLFDGQAGLHDNYFRDYDPAVGRYIQSDPIGLDGGSYSTYVYAKSLPLRYTDPTGLSPFTDLTKLFGWLSPQPLSAAECRSLRDQIYKKNLLLQDELEAYNPVLDGMGGFPMGYGSGVTKPGGHYKEIKDLQRGLKQDLKTYNQRCRCDDNDDGNPPISKNVDELANTPVPLPVYPRSIFVMPLGPIGIPGGAPVLSPAPVLP